MKNVIYSCYFFIRKIVCRQLLWAEKENVSIICNNCLGADILNKYGMRFNSPTVNLQILACDFTDFCNNLNYYRKAPIKQITNGIEINEIQKRCFKDTFGGRGIDELLNEMPMGLLDEKILIVFQHYASFDEAVIKWQERFDRIQDKCKCLFVVYDKQIEFGQEFVDSDKINDKTIVTINFRHDFEGMHKIKYFTVYGKGHFMDKASLFYKNYEKTFNTYKWLKG